ncbi:MAG: hypothetical protein EOP10_21445 [Proteobacteria bacterium]|nr:MAG: hypothetical protein EOP10_21445 [Pseudomonadota bacterium]
MKVVATLVNPAQETSTVSGTTTIIVKPAAASAAASPTDVDFDAISQICENKCNYIYPDVVGEEGPSYLGKVDVLRQAQVGAKTFTDYSWGYMRWIREETGAKDVKICENMQKPFDSAKKAFGKDPDQLWMLLSSGWNDLTYYYYRAPDCNRKFLMDRTSCGCFQEDTQITLGDGQSTRAIHELTESDRVWNPILKKAQRIKRMTRGPEALPMLTIQTASGSVTVTGGHPFPLPDGSIVQAHDLKAGDQVLVNEAWETILTVEIKQSAQQPVVWNLELTGDDRQDSHFILANGIVTGDLKIQEDIGVKK